MIIGNNYIPVFIFSWCLAVYFRWIASAYVPTCIFSASIRVTSMVISRFSSRSILRNNIVPMTHDTFRSGIGTLTTSPICPYNCVRVFHWVIDFHAILSDLGDSGQEMQRAGCFPFKWPHLVMIPRPCRMMDLAKLGCRIGCFSTV